MKPLFVKSVDNMDDPFAIYKKDGEHYLISTELQDSTGSDIMIPVKIDGKEICNDVYVGENQILSVYGRKTFQESLRRNNFEPIYAKKEPP